MESKKTDKKKMRKKRKQKRRSLKITATMFAVLFAASAIGGCGSASGDTETDGSPVSERTEISDAEATENTSKENNYSRKDYINMVKDAANEDYAGKTYGEVFDFYFSDPDWNYFKGVQEGPDDDGDGKPDYTKEDIDVVQFTGGCTYLDVEVEALIQFTVDVKAGTFEASYLSFNEVPQSSLMLAELLDSVFLYEAEEQTENSQLTEAISRVVSETELSREDIEGLDAESARIIRNTVYARHGKIFQDEVLNTYFAAFSWYSPKNQDIGDEVLSAADIHNRDLVLEYENGLGNSGGTTEADLTPYLGILYNASNGDNYISLSIDDSGKLHLVEGNTVTDYYSQTYDSYEIDNDHDSLCCYAGTIMDIFVYLEDGTVEVLLEGTGSTHYQTYITEESYFNR